MDTLFSQEREIDTALAEIKAKITKKSEKEKDIKPVEKAEKKT